MSHPDYLKRWGLAFGAGMLILCAERAALATWMRPASATDPLWSAFLVGTRFDAASVAYLLIPAVLASTLAALWTRSTRVQTTTVAISVLSITTLAFIDYHFFREFHRRLDFVALEYLDEPSVALGMAASHVGAGWLLAQLVVTVGIVAAVLRGGRSRTPTGAAGIGHHERVVSLCRGAGLLALLVIAARGGLGRPLRPQDAAVGSDYFTRQLALSGPFTLARHAYEAVRRSDQAPAYGVTDIAAVTASLRASVGQDGQTLHDGAGPMYRSGAAHPAPWTNVVMVVLESFAARHVGTLGAQESWTPAFDRLAERGVVFTRFLANGPSTNRGLPALLAGIPSLPGRFALTKSMEGQQPLLTLGRILGDAGASTHFLTAGQASWENLGGWCAAQGFDAIVDADDFHPDQALSVWGVSDDELLERSLAECDRAAGTGAFCSVTLTSSNHPPFALPDDTSHPGSPGRERAFRYADAALGRFMDAALARAWAGKTLFVLVGDHGLHDRARAELDPERYHVPLVLIDGAATPRPPLAPRHETRITSQVDVLPTVLGLLGVPGPHAAWGRDAFAPHPRHRTAIMGPHGGLQAVAATDDRGLFVVVPLTRGAALTAYHWDAAADTLVAVPVDAAAEALARHARETLFVAEQCLSTGTAGAR